MAIDDADTVALVFHGVGDHSPEEIIGDARNYLSRDPNGQLALAELELAGFPSPTAMEPTALGPNRQHAIRIESGNRIHYLIPVMWSSFRLRATKPFHTFVPGSIFQTFPDSLLRMIILCGDGIRCIPRAAGGWGLALFAAMVVSVGFVALLTFGFLFVPVKAMFFVGVPLQPGFHWYSLLLWFCIILAFDFLVRRCATVLDFVGDVVGYVSRDVKRAELELTVHNIIAFIAERAPNARILIVGHSLGSVLVAQCLAKPSPTWQTRRGIILVTLGSPLKLMAKAFPRYVQSPPQLYKAFTNSGEIVFWANFWRDYDFIGKSLGLVPSEHYAETSLGPGVHWSIWGDGRLWKFIARLLASPEQVRLDLEPPSFPLSATEHAELRFLRFEVLDTRRFGLFFTLPMTGWTAVGLFWRPWLQAAGHPLFRFGLIGLWFLGLAVTILFFRWGGKLIEPKATDRVSLESLKVLRAVYVISWFVPLLFSFLPGAVAYFVLGPF